MPHQSPTHGRRGWIDWFELMIKDHGFLRIFWTNRHEFSPGFWRSNQPAPKNIRAIKKLGIKTVINLRGARSDGGWRLEKEACDIAGITLIDFTIRSRDVPDAALIRRAKTVFEQVQMPALIHCKSGADRAGIMAAIYLLLEKNASVDDALKMLSLKYLHVRQSKTGLLDAFIKAYRPAEARNIDFIKWAETELDPAAIKSRFTARSWAVRLVDNVLRRE
ncbi:MAG: fused DSP-PTPase phosphatase/NAD kinase-like protein [Candidatus Puniceispirillales bacterium WSBS_2018_MAG_OTU23]